MEKEFLNDLKEDVKDVWEDLLWFMKATKQMFRDFGEGYKQYKTFDKVKQKAVRKNVRWFLLYVFKQGTICAAGIIVSFLGAVYFLMIDYYHANMLNYIPFLILCVGGVLIMTYGINGLTFAEIEKSILTRKNKKNVTQFVMYKKMKSK